MSATEMRVLPPDLDRLGTVLTEAIRRSQLPGGGAVGVAAPEGADGLPLGAGPRWGDEPDDRPDDGQADARGEAGLLAVALAVGQVAGGDRRQQPDVEVDERLGADQREQGGHVPRDAFCTSG